jgi:hypothetical protein
MGYDIRMNHASFHIGSQHKPALLAVMKSMATSACDSKDYVSRVCELGTFGCEIRHREQRRFMWMNDVDFSKWSSVEEAFKAWRYPVKISEINGDIIGIRFDGEKLGDEQMMFDTIAPFCHSRFIHRDARPGRRDVALAIPRWSDDRDTTRNTLVRCLTFPFTLNIVTGWRKHAQHQGHVERRTGRSRGDVHACANRAGLSTSGRTTGHDRGGSDRQTERPRSQAGTEAWQADDRCTEIGGLPPDEKVLERAASREIGTLLAHSCPLRPRKACGCGYNPWPRRSLRSNPGRNYSDGELAACFPICAILVDMNTPTRARIIKGCAARGLTKGSTIYISSIVALGADYSHSVRVNFQVLNGQSAGRSFAFYARHLNRLSDPIIGLNDGNPLHTIRIEVR